MIELGQELWLRPTGNLARMGYKVFKDKVTKIGRKYFYIDDLKFDKDTLENINPDCNSSWEVYFSEREILDKDRKKQLVLEVQLHFRKFGGGSELSLYQLEQIAKILGLEDSDE